jgi:hypothetical protein
VLQQLGYPVNIIAGAAARPRAIMRNWPACCAPRHAGVRSCGLSAPPMLWPASRR